MNIEKDLFTYFTLTVFMIGFVFGIIFSESREVKK